MKSRNATRSLILAVTAFSLAGTSQLTLGDSLAPNAPVGVGWSYGEYSAGTPASFQQFAGPTLLTGALAGLEEWVGGVSRISPTGTDPNIILNTTANDILTDPDAGNIDFAAGTINLGPWYGPTVVRYTASVSGTYDAAASFETAQLGNTSPDAYVYVNGALNYSTGQLADPSGANRFGDASIFNQNGIILNAGDTVDFVVWGSDAHNKTTQLSAVVALTAGSVAPVPLPASAGLGFSMLTGLGLIAGIRKRLARGTTIV